MFVFSYVYINYSTNMQTFVAKRFLTSSFFVLLIIIFLLDSFFAFFLPNNILYESDLTHVHVQSSVTNK